MINKLGIQHNKILFMRMTDQLISAKLKVILVKILYVIELLKIYPNQCKNSIKTV